jgi:hypothetical protein
MNLLRRLFRPSIEDSARHLGKLGAQTRQERARAKRKAFHRELRQQLGLPAVEAFKP